MPYLLFYPVWLLGCVYLAVRCLLLSRSPDGIARAAEVLRPPVLPLCLAATAMLAFLGKISGGISASTGWRELTIPGSMLAIFPALGRSIRSRPKIVLILTSIPLAAPVFLATMAWLGV